MIQNVAMMMPVVSFAMVFLVIRAIAAARGSLQDCGSEAVVHGGRAKAMCAGTSGCEAKEENKVGRQRPPSSSAEISRWTCLWDGRRCGGEGEGGRMDWREKKDEGR
jgi:hypothetical protein